MKGFDFNRFVDDQGVDVSPTGHKHSRPGWVNLECPFCTGNPGYHLGWNIQGDFFHCHRCGFHTHFDVVRSLTNGSTGDVQALLESYGVRHQKLEEDKVIVVRPNKITLPMGCQDLLPIHKRYLRSRNFNPSRIKRLWGIQGTGPVGPYKFRVIAPIYFNGKLVSYQGRDVTGRSSLRYKACPKEKEVIDHKNVLYGIDLVPGDSIVIVEGITDAWRLGPGAVSTFGIEYKKSQVVLMKRFKKRFIFFDWEPQAYKQARKLASELSGFSGTTEIIRMNSAKDPALLSDQEAREIMRDLI